LSAVPSSTKDFLIRLDKLPVVIGAIAGLALAVWTAPKRIWMPLALFLTGVGTFFMVGVAGLSVIQRYLLVPSLMVMIFAGVALGGWTMLREGSRLRRVLAVGGAAPVCYGGVFTATPGSLSLVYGQPPLRG